MSREFDPTLTRIRQILLEDWDPHDAFKRPEAHGAYDAWIDPLHETLNAGATEEQVMDWLHEREKETMCFPSIGRERLRRIARKLRQIVNSPSLIPEEPSQ
jgi:hypothetical protein